MANLASGLQWAETAVLDKFFILLVSPACLQGSLFFSPKIIFFLKPKIRDLSFHSNANVVIS